MKILCNALALALTLATASAMAASDPPASLTLPSGVVVDLKQTPAASAHYPSAANSVRVHYRGTLADGTEFDSSYKRNSPASFGLSQVIPCWTQGVQRIPVGGKAVLTCPASTAYGAAGIPGAIPPNAQLTFEVELLAILN